MAARTAQAVDYTSLLHTGQVSVACAGFTDPAGNPWIVMNDAAAAVNAVQIGNAAAGVAPTITVGGVGADTNASIIITGAGTGAVKLGSSVSPVTLAGAPTISSNLTVSGAATITGNLSASTVTASAGVTAFSNSPSSAALRAVSLGSSGPQILWGSSIPTSSAVAGSIFLMTAAAASNLAMYVQAGNGTGGASSSNWIPVAFQ